MRAGDRLTGKVAIISGAASGIGAETARVFAAHGARVVLCDVQDAFGFAVTQEIVAAGGAAEYRTLDVCSEDQWAALVETAEQRYGRIDVLANIAGIAGAAPEMSDQGGSPAAAALAGQTLANWNRVMDVNAAGVFLGTRSVIKAMQRGGGGSVINMSSICGIVGSFANAAYHAAKGAVRIFSKSAAIQCAKFRIRVNSVHPGFVDTPMTNLARRDREVVQAWLGATPLGRFGTPRDVALGCLYLASDESAWVTGSELVIDGGLTAN
jgi:NAD(P)-dependent dehydrogenase (short-subunit alcohol dehydrogenase family)